MDDDEIGYEDEFKEYEENQKNINNNSSSNNNNQNDNNNINNMNNNQSNNNFDVNNFSDSQNNKNNNDDIINDIINDNKINQQKPLVDNKNEEEEKNILMEIENLENEKQKWYDRRKEQNDILQKNIELLNSLINMNTFESQKFSKNNSKIELNNLLSYNSKLSQIESEERILEEDKKYFEQYKTNFNRMYEEKQNEIEKLKLNYEKEKDELDKRLALLEIEEKMINEKYNNFENEKKIMTEKYNNALQTESSLNISKMRIENNLQELDRRNLAIQRKGQIIDEKIKEVQSQIIKNNYEEKRIYDEKNNLKLRQEMIDSLRMKYVGDLVNDQFDYTQNENIGNSKFNTFNENKNLYNDNILMNRHNILNNTNDNKDNKGDFININKKEENEDAVDINPQKYLLKDYNEENYAKSEKEEE
jgi:hypothetical protein